MSDEEPAALRARRWRRRRWVAPVAVVLLGTYAGPADGRGLRLGDRPLGPGATGADVRELQRTLGRLGIPVAVSGAFETETVAAVQRYERRVGSTPDGLVTVRQADAMRGRAGTLAFGARTLRRGMEGRDVRRLQGVLTDMGMGTASDGDFGRSTERSVRRYEQREGLRVDGAVTPAQSRGMVKRVRASQVPVAAPTSTAPGVRRFPIAGAWTYSGEGGHFHDRGGEHEGEDLLAACGTPLVAAETATVVFTGVQSRAGNYLVLRGAESGQDLVYMHLLAPTPLARGAVVPAGGQVGQVGRTGRATGCHLHLEVWAAPGWYRGGKPIDPRPNLAAWAAAGAR